jgi:hypothetical protein
LRNNAPASPGSPMEGLERSRSQAASPTIENEQMTLENGHLRRLTVHARDSKYYRREIAHQAFIYDGEQSPMVVRRKCIASPNDDN